VKKKDRPLDVTIWPSHNEHVEVAVDGPARIACFIDPHEGLSVVVYKGTQRTHDRRKPVLSWFGGTLRKILLTGTEGLK